MKISWWLAFFLFLLPVFGLCQAINVPYRGLDYSMISKGGLTVMVAPMSLSILNYSAAHVWVTNGSGRPVHLEPQSFVARTRSARQAQPAEFAALSDAIVVKQVMDRAKFNDIMALVRAYEQNLYGFRNPDAINYYEVRKQVAAASGGSRKLRAAATVSAIILPRSDIPPGEFREGTIFFQTGDKRSEFVELSTNLGGLSFVFHPQKPQ